MKESDRKLAEAVIARLCDGAQIDGIRFGPILQILITDRRSDRTPVDGQVYLNLGSPWMLTDGVPAIVPSCEEEFPQLSPDEEVAQICAIREQTIVWTCLGVSEPHLFIGLDSGKVFCLNGHHDMYETWQLGTALGEGGERWLVVACPGDEIAVWAPPGFNA